MRHTYECPLRWSDMDAYGHVNNVVYLRYLEEARIDFLFREAGQQALGSGDEPPFRGGSVVARHEIDYLSPLFHRHEPVTIETWVTKLNAASATLAYEIKDTARVYVRATTLIVPYDMKEERVRRLTAGERTFLEGFFDDSAEAPRIR